MKKRILFRRLRIKSAMTVALVVTCFLVTAHWSLVTAQVAIGGDGSVATGSVLDLSQQGAATGGLLLPQVVLTAENANPFGEGGSETLPAGLLVYNIGSEIEGAALDEGVYVLQAGLWKPTGSGSGGGGIPVVNVSITPNTPFSLGVGNTAPMDFSTYPPNATYPSMSWNSSDTDIATISNLGVVTGVSPGNTNISLTLGSVTSDPVAVTVAACGTPFTAPSGKVYNTAAYSNANLTNLCWTTTNLQEAGYSATCYSNNCGSYPTRGYYYTPGANSDNACAALNSGGHTWRVPTTAEWVALQTAFPSLAAGVGTTGNTATLQADWNSAAILGGGFYYTTTWRYFNEMNHYYAQGPSSACYYFTVGSTTVNRDTRTDYWISVRCVRSL